VPSPNTPPPNSSEMWYTRADVSEKPYNSAFRAEKEGKNRSLTLMDLPVH